MKASRHNLHRSWKNESGIAAVEFALISFMLLMTTLGAFEAGRVFFMYHRLTVALGGTTRLVQMQAPEDALITSITSRFSASEQGALSIQVDPSVVLNGATYTRIDAQYALPLIMPGFNFFPGQIYTLRASQLVPTG